MKSVVYLRMSLAVLLIGGLGGAMAEAQFPEADASYLVRITHNPSVIPLSEDTLDALVNSAGVRGVVLHDLPPEVRQDIELSFETVEQARDDVLIGRILVRNAPDGADGGRKLLGAICDRLRDALAQAADADSEYLKRRIEQSKNELDEAYTEYGVLQQKEAAMCKAAGRSKLDHDQIAEEIANFQNQRRTIQADMVTVHAREQALAAKIADISNRVEQAAGKDEVLHEMQSVVDIKEKELSRMRQLVESGNAPETQFLQVLEETARTRAELAERRKDAQRMNGGDMLEHLNSELVELSIRSAENDAKVAWITDQLDDIDKRGLLELAAQHDREVAMKMQLLWSKITDTSSELQDLETQLRSLREPQVLVIGGEQK